MSEQVRALVKEAFVELSDLLPPGVKLDAGGDAPLLEAHGGPLDSLGVVNLMVALEGSIARAFDKSVSLAESLASMPDDSPYRTPDALVQYLEGVLALHPNGG